VLLFLIETYFLTVLINFEYTFQVCPLAYILDCVILIRPHARKNILSSAATALRKINSRSVSTYSTSPRSWPV